MKVGLVRHFRVKHAYPENTFIHYRELVKWFEHYESADVEYKDVDMCGIKWHKCYASAAPRALKTAGHIFNGNIIKCNELTELAFLPLVNRKLRLPLVLWAMFIRYRALSSNHLTNQFKMRIKLFADELMANNNKNILICSHGFVMMFLQKELLQRGFKGNRFKTPANGKIYIFEK
jgi:broad specificity phosphatase PhoE